MSRIFQTLLSYLLALSGIGLNLSGNLSINLGDFDLTTNTGTIEISTTSLTKEPGEQVYKIRIGEDRDEVIVGDEASPLQFKPEITFTKWNKESSLTILPPEDLIPNGRLSFENNQLTYQNDKIGWYTKPDPDNNENFKFGLILNDYTDSSETVIIDGEEYSQWTFKLEGWEEYNFFYQPSLTEEWKIGDEDGRIVKITETDCFDKDGNLIVHRPIDVVGSYAVYHKSKRDNIIGKTNYMTGKFSHIYRPRFISATGDTQWAKLDIKDGVYKVAVLKKWKDFAVRPIKANDTFGATSQGGSEFSPNGVAALKGSPVGNGNCSTISAWLHNNSGSTAYDARGGIYNHDGVNDLPEDLLQDSGVFSLALGFNGLRDFTITSQAITLGTNYWVAIGTTNDNLTLYYDTTTPGRSVRDLGVGIFDNPFSNSPDNIWTTLTFSIYATYTPSGGGGGTNAILKNSTIKNAIIR